MGFLSAALMVADRSFQTLSLLFPYLLGGIVLGELLKLTSWTKILYKWVNRSPVLSIFTAAILGAISPLCTVGTVPVMLRLYGSGVKIAPLITFLVSSSMMNPQLFIITWGGLGAEIAFVRLGAVLVFSWVLGAIANIIPENWIVRNKIPADVEIGKDIVGKKKKVDWKTFCKEIAVNLEYIGFFVIIGTLIGSIFETAVPSGWFRSVFVPGSWISVLFGAVLGVPLYACGGGTIPLVQAFMKEGMNKASALAFLIVGPATRVAPLAALASVIRVRFILFYIVSLFLFSIGIGFVYR